MSNEERARQDWKFHKAVVIKRIATNGKFQYRISPRELNGEKDVPMGGFYSNWCSTEERAWKAALCRRWHKIYSVDSSIFE